ncbi:hypothetical protein HID58_093611 [Brassica napus]|uniref:Uncharacterized protein n=1 Tax=Brassica napus TaxID=3708 RepID=A0ABQ7XAE7_BRANA|nr:hypothetical protein HID58_093611 [Brassica napus]
MEYTSAEGEKAKKRYDNAIALVASGDYIKAFEIFDDVISVFPEEHRNSFHIRVQQANIFLLLVDKALSKDVEITYFLGAIGCVSEDVRVTLLRTRLLRTLGMALDSVFYFKKCIRSGKQGLAAAEAKNKTEIERLIKEAELMIDESKTSPTIAHYWPKFSDSEDSQEPRCEDRVGDELRSYWMGLDVKIKRDFMKVSVEKLRSFVKGVHTKVGVDVLKNVLDVAREHKKWRVWVCRTKCDKVCSSAEECRTHLEQKHAAVFKPSSEEDVVMRIGINWAKKIQVGPWEPVRTVAAVEMIKAELEYVKGFTSTSRKKGWSSEWPVAADEERSGLLMEIKLLLVSLCNHQILSCSIRDWVMSFPVKHLRKLGVSEESINDCRLVESPQSICFLGRDELKQIRGFLKKIKCERHDGTDHVGRAVDSLLDRIRIKENIDIDVDAQFSLLLLDKRLLKSNNAPFDDDREIKFIDKPDSHYDEAQVKGDDIISWLGDRSSVDRSFPGPIRKHNLVIWVAVLRALQFTCKTLGTKYAKKKQVLDYEAALTAVENLCMSEDERNSYASLLCDRFEDRVHENPLTAKLFLCAVRDVFEGGLHLTFDIPDLEDCLNLIRERSKSLSNDTVLKSIKLQKSAVTEKVLLIDARILLIDNSRIRLLNNLTSLSAFDNRSYMLYFLKPFLLSDIGCKLKADLLLKEETKSQTKNKTKTKSTKMPKPDAAEADHLFKEDNKSHGKKKKTSTSMSTPVDKLEHKPSVDLEPGGTSQSPKTMEPEDTLTTEKGPLEISSTNDIQEEATKVNTGDMQNMPGENSVSGNLESALGGAATRYNSALDMTLKALMNINVLKEDLKRNKQPFHGNLEEEQVLPALQSLFTAVVSEEIKTEGVYCLILRDLLVSLEQVNSMSSSAAEVLVTILESWHCWKNSERESLVDRLFTLEENERMSCRKCRRMPNYPEQCYYGIVMASDSIRDFKCAFRKMKFVDILKVLRMEYKMLCDIKSGGCGTENFVHHLITKCPPIFIIVLEWEKSETEKEISETTKALEWEIDISRLYEGLEPNTNYRLVSMVGYGDEEREHICMAYEKNRWVNLGRESLAGEADIVNICGGADAIGCWQQLEECGQILWRKEGCVSEYTPLLEFCARLFHLLARSLGSALYYKKTLRRAKHELSLSSVPQPDDNKVRDEFSLENVTKEAEFMIAESKIMVRSWFPRDGLSQIRSIRKYAPPPEVCDSKKGEDRVGGELRSYWMGLDVKVKRDFMKVSVERVRRFVKGVHKSKGVDVLKHVMAIAREHKKWRVWVCRTKCDKVCFSAEECRTHLEEKHAANMEKDVVMRIGINWAYKIQHGRWEPVDTVAAVEMIKTQLEDVEAFTTKSRKKGWSDQWPLATADEGRSDLLKEVKLLLVSLCEHQILSCSIRDWVMSFPVKHLKKLEVSEESLKDCRIVETPQSICFLEREELKQIRGFLKKIKCERHDGTDLVGRAVDSLLDRIRIKESIEFNEKFSLLLLDKILLKSNNALSDDDDYEGKIKLIKDPDVHYAKAQAQGDDIISWLGDHSSVDKSFPVPIREHNLVIWVAVLRALQYTCKTLGTKYAKKEHVLEYEAALLVVENLCDERRKTVQENQWNSYASLLCDRFEDRVHENPLTAKLFLCAVRDVFEGGLHLTFDIADLEDCMNLIRERSKSLSNDKVLKSIELLKSMVTEKVLRIDAKILLTDNSRIRLLDKLTRLSAYDNRSYMLYFLKPFLLVSLKLYLYICRLIWCLICFLYIFM